MTGLYFSRMRLYEPGLSHYKLRLAILFVSFTFVSDLYAQDFTRLTIDSSITWVSGVSWIDYDNDGDLDLFTSHNDFGGVATFDPARNQNKLFRNDGDDSFVHVMPADISNTTSFSGGQTWADYDNDGDIDLYSTNKNYIYEVFLNTSTQEGSALFRNEGPADNAFTRILSGDITGDNRISAFAAAWADYNNDGYVDLFITTPKTNAYPTGDSLTNVLFDNNGDGSFTRDTSSLIVNGPIDFYTIPTWSDYDKDGDMDLFITSGPIQNGVLQPDYMYKNLLKETGTADFERDLTTNFAAEGRDGQQANWIDFDNDQDFDLYVTNFGGTPGGAPNSTQGMVNHFYRNDGAGNYTKIETGPQSTDVKISLGQTWGDFDNDGDLDLYVTNLTSFNSRGGNNYYQNNGPPDYTFSKITTGDFVTGVRASWGAASGDYDNDGDLDLYVAYTTLTAGGARDALYRNDLNNGAHWINIECVGTSSNRSAIGAKVMVKATISGNTYWQQREISAQNASTGQNSLRAHFGLGNATMVDSVRIEWPSGHVDTFTDMSVDEFFIATENSSLVISPVSDEKSSLLPQDVKLYVNYPNPFYESTMLRFELPSTMEVQLHVFDVLGREVVTMVNSEIMGAGKHEVSFEATGLPPGVYIARLQAGFIAKVQSMILLQ